MFIWAPMNCATKTLSGVHIVRWRTDLHNLTVFQNDNPICQRHRFDLIVGYINHRAGQRLCSVPFQTACRPAMMHQGSTAVHQKEAFWFTHDGTANGDVDAAQVLGRRPVIRGFKVSAAVAT